MKLIREVLNDLAPTWLLVAFTAGIIGGVALAQILDFYISRARTNNLLKRYKNHPR